MSKAASIPVPVESPHIEEKSPGVLAAEEELKKYVKAEQDLIAELDDLLGKLEEENAGVGDAILAAKLSGGDADAINQGITRTWLKMDSTKRALRSASRARANAEAGILNACADQKREEAAALRAEVKVRMEKTNELLEQLREHEGVKFVPPVPIDPSGVGIKLNTPSTRSGEILMRAIDLESEAKRLEEESARIRQRAQAEYSRAPGQ